MRFLAIGLVLLIGCASWDDEAQDDKGAEHRSSAAQTESCAATVASKLLWDATRVLYDYEPLTAAALIERSTVIVHGRLESMSTSDDADDTRAVFAVKVGDVYKGDARPGDTVRVLQSRSPTVTAKDLAKISRDFPDVSITLFVYQSENHGGYLLTSMQGFVTASDCDAEQPFGEAPIFTSASSDAEFDAALRSAIHAAGS